MVTGPSGRKFSVICKCWTAALHFQAVLSLDVSGCRMKSHKAVRQPSFLKPRSIYLSVPTWPCEIMGIAARR